MEFGLSSASFCACSWVLCLSLLYCLIYKSGTRQRVEWEDLRKHKTISTGWQGLNLFWIHLSFLTYLSCPPAILRWEQRNTYQAFLRLYGERGSEKGKMKERSAMTQGSGPQFCLRKIPAPKGKTLYPFSSFYARCRSVSLFIVKWIVGGPMQSQAVQDGWGGQWTRTGGRGTILAPSNDEN